MTGSETDSEAETGPGHTFGHGHGIGTGHGLGHATGLDLTYEKREALASPAPLPGRRKPMFHDDQYHSDGHGWVRIAWLAGMILIPACTSMPVHHPATQKDKGKLEKLREEVKGSGDHDDDEGEDEDSAASILLDLDDEGDEGLIAEGEPSCEFAPTVPRGPS
ncbi:MAG: hypothetical protein AB1486_25690 [Planctomycetota bacterium]